MYAKLIDGTLQAAPKKLVYKNITVYNPSTKLLNEAGYKYVEFVPIPDTPVGSIAVERYVERETKIVQYWDIVELPDEIDNDEAMQIIFGEGV